MRKLFLALLVGPCAFVNGQNIQNEIDEQVWKPFIRTFNSLDTEGFMAVHSKDAVCSPRDSKSVWNFTEYAKKRAEGNKRSLENGTKKNLQLRFTERLTGKDLAVDVGVYKSTFTDSQGQSSPFYGRFHVVLRKENGVWKILVDTDSSEGGTIGEKDFLAAKPIE